MDSKNLVITRQVGKGIFLLQNGEIIAKISIARIQKSQVRLLIQAPPSLVIMRTEILEKGKDEQSSKA